MVQSDLESPTRVAQDDGGHGDGAKLRKASVGTTSCVKEGDGATSTVSCKSEAARHVDASG